MSAMTTNEINQEIRDQELAKQKIKAVPMAQRTAEDKAQIMVIDARIKALQKALQKAMRRELEPSTHTEQDQQLAALQRIFANPILWFENFQRLNTLEVNGAGVILNGEHIKHMDFRNHILVQLLSDQQRIRDLGADVKVPPRDLIDAVVQQWYSKAVAKFKKHTIVQVMHVPGQGDEALRRWLYLTTGHSSPLYVSVMKHWIQCVKKKMLGMPVDYHLFPIFYGRQGDGKTTAIRRLLEPVRSLTLNLTVDQSMDTTYLGMFEEKAVVFFDEMSGADKAEVAQLKRNVSADAVDGRPPYGRRVEPIKQNCMFIGASNKRVDEMIKDNEMRRFVQIESIKRSDEHMDELDKLDVLAIWRCVDELESFVYYKEGRHLIEEHQKDLVTLGPVEQWQHEFGVHRPVLGDPGKWVSVREMHAHYTKWRISCGYQYDINENAFGKMLHFGDAKRRAMADGAKVTLYCVSSQCTALDTVNSACRDAFDITKLI
jgi:hypothetical protein